MSYDIYLEIDTGGPEPVSVGRDHNYTRNCSPMWRKAGVDLREFDGKQAADCIDPLAKACDEMARNPTRYAAMNPENGWGDYDSCLEFLRRLLADLTNNPKTMVRVSW